MHKCKLTVESDRVLLDYYGRRFMFFHNRSNTQLRSILSLLYEQYLVGSYDRLDVKGKIVVDIGASIGDTAMLFATRGAKHVYTYEPYPFAYALAKKNINANKLNGKITIFNRGCGKSGKIRVSSSESTGSTDLRASKSGKTIQIVSLDEIVDELDISDGVLKLDCEGCEYAVLLGAKKETLRRFNQIILEYHYGYKDLVRKLKGSGFEVEHDEPTKLYEPWKKRTWTYLGYIFAKRK